MSPPSRTARLRPAEDSLGTPPKHPTLAGLPKDELLSHRTIDWRDTIPQGIGNRPPVGAMAQQGHGFSKGCNIPKLQATVPTGYVYDSSKEGLITFKRPYFDEDQHVA